MTPSQKLVHHSTERLGGHERGAIKGAHGQHYLRGKSISRPLGVRDQSEVVLDTHLCSPVVSERASSARGDWLWVGARLLVHG